MPGKDVYKECIICHQMTNDRHMLRHMLKCDGWVFVCRLEGCGRFVTQNDSLNAHCEAMHGSKNNYAWAMGQIDVGKLTSGEMRTRSCEANRELKDSLKTNMPDGPDADQWMERVQAYRKDHKLEWIIRSQLTETELANSKAQGVFKSTVASKDLKVPKLKRYREQLAESQRRQSLQEHQRLNTSRKRKHSSQSRAKERSKTKSTTQPSTSARRGRSSTSDTVTSKSTTPPAPPSRRGRSSLANTVSGKSTTPPAPPSRRGRSSLANTVSGKKPTPIRRAKIKLNRRPKQVPATKPQFQDPAFDSSGDSDEVDDVAGCSNSGGQAVSVNNKCKNRSTKQQKASSNKPATKRVKVEPGAEYQLTPENSPLHGLSHCPTNTDLPEDQRQRMMHEEMLRYHVPPSQDNVDTMSDYERALNPADSTASVIGSPAEPTQLSVPASPVEPNESSVPAANPADQTLDSTSTPKNNHLTKFRQKQTPRRSPVLRSPSAGPCGRDLESTIDRLKHSAGHNMSSGIQTPSPSPNMCSTNASVISSGGSGLAGALEELNQRALTGYVSPSLDDSPRRTSVILNDTDLLRAVDTKSPSIASTESFGGSELYDSDVDAGKVDKFEDERSVYTTASSIIKGKPTPQRHELLRIFGVSSRIIDGTTTDGDLLEVYQEMHAPADPSTAMQSSCVETHSTRPPKHVWGLCDRANGICATCNRTGVNESFTPTIAPTGNHDNQMPIIQTLMADLINSVIEKESTSGISTSIAVGECFTDTPALASTDNQTEQVPIIQKSLDDSIDCVIEKERESAHVTTTTQIELKSSGSNTRTAVNESFTHTPTMASSTGEYAEQRPKRIVNKKWRDTAFCTKTDECDALITRCTEFALKELKSPNSMVKVVDIPGKGKGLVVQGDVLPGDPVSLYGGDFTQVDSLNNRQEQKLVTGGDCGRKTAQFTFKDEKTKKWVTVGIDGDVPNPFSGQYANHHGSTGINLRWLPVQMENDMWNVPGVDPMQVVAYATKPLSAGTELVWAYRLLQKPKERWYTGQKGKQQVLKKKQRSVSYVLPNKPFQAPKKKQRSVSYVLPKKR